MKTAWSCETLEFYHTTAQWHDAENVGSMSLENVGVLTHYMVSQPIRWR